jgi:hypothetical protein
MSQDDIEAMIEAHISRMTDHLDRMFLLRQISQDAYSKALKDLHDWAEGKRKAIS